MKRRHHPLESRLESRGAVEAHQWELIILRAALESFAGVGFRLTRMRHLQRRTGLSTGTIYHYFTGKEDIAMRLFREGVSTYQRAFLGQLNDDRQTADGVRACVEFHLEWVKANPRLAHFIINRRETEPIVGAGGDPGMRSANERFFFALQDWIARAAAEEQLRSLPPRLYYPTWMGPAHQFARQWLSRRDAAAFREARTVLPAMAWAALRPDQAPVTALTAHLAWR